MPNLVPRSGEPQAKGLGLPKVRYPPCTVFSRNKPEWSSGFSGKGMVVGRRSPHSGEGYRGSSRTRLAFG